MSRHKTLHLHSPAKLNLYLRVLNKRKDGYHNIVTLFERIDLFDVLTFRCNAGGGIKIYCDHPDVPKGAKNLVYKAAQMLKKEHRVSAGVDIRIKKQIPVAAGLGGGSSNAATALLALNRLWRLSLTQKELLGYAKRIGADVAFFIHDCRWALGEERGDEIRRIPLKTRLWHILVVPRIKMYTKAVYEAFQPAKTDITYRKSEGYSTGPVPRHFLTNQKQNVNILIRHLRQNDLRGVGQFILNDLESSSFRLCSNLKELKETVLNHAPLGGLLSGSGPSIFGLVKTKKEAEKIRSVLRKKYSQSFVVGSL